MLSIATVLTQDTKVTWIILAVLDILVRQLMMPDRPIRLRMEEGEGEEVKIGTLECRRRGREVGMEWVGGNEQWITERFF